MHLFWSQKVQWRGTGEESKCVEGGRKERQPSGSTANRASWWIPVIWEWRCSYPFKFEEILPPFRVWPKYMAECALWLFWFLSHLILFGEKTWRTFVWQGNQYGSEQRLHTKSRRSWVRKLEVTQGDLEEDHRGGGLRLCCPTPKGLPRDWLTPGLQISKLKK